MDGRVLTPSLLEDKFESDSLLDSPRTPQTNQEVSLNSYLESTLGDKDPTTQVHDSLEDAFGNMEALSIASSDQTRNNETVDDKDAEMGPVEETKLEFPELEYTNGQTELTEASLWRLKVWIAWHRNDRLRRNSNSS